MAQVILSSIATSIMTVVSIVFAILLMTLTLASTQFSPRILISFVRDRTTQWTLGVFLGTFSYCMAALPAARALPHPFVPVVTVRGDAARAGVRGLVDLLHQPHLSINQRQSHRRSYCGETELVIKNLCPIRGVRSRHRIGVRRSARDGPLLSRRSGYIRYVDIKHLIALAQAYRISVHLERRVGQFVPAGVPLRACRNRSACRPTARSISIPAFDIGPTRTMQQDVEFGIIQIVDIALRAMSRRSRSQYRDQLRGPAQPNHDPLDWPHAAAISLLRAAARTAPLRAVDELRWPARYGVRADQTLCRRRYRGKFAASARFSRYRNRYRAR